MTKDEFTNLFADHVIGPLRSAGFTTTGQSLYFGDHQKQVALIRGGGRLTRPGAVTHILALRQPYMRETSSKLDVPCDPPRQCEHYPFLLDPQYLLHTGPGQWQFDPSRHLSKPWGRIHYADSNEADIAHSLQQLATQILDRWLPWGDQLDPQSIIQQFDPYVENFWVARIWQEDCQNHIENEVNNTK